MEFKIDTKNTYSVVTPVINRIDANLTAALRQKWDELRQSGSQNMIVDMHNCLDVDKASLTELVGLHEEIYSSDESLVFTGLQDGVLQVMKENETDQLLNIAPTMAEAIDIVSMEILERDLFREE